MVIILFLINAQETRIEHRVPTMCFIKFAGMCSVAQWLEQGI
jgi:hypothetical protein